MNRVLLPCLTLLIFTSCDFDRKQRNTKETTPGKQWVYISIESNMTYDTANYFLYGQIKNSTLKELENDETSGMFSIENLRFYNDSNQLEIYEDNSYFGKKFFKKADVNRMDLLKKDPIYTTDINELAENSKALLAQKPSK